MMNNMSTHKGKSRIGEKVFFDYFGTVKAGTIVKDDKGLWFGVKGNRNGNEHIYAVTEDEIIYTDLEDIKLVQKLLDLGE